MKDNLIISEQFTSIQGEGQTMGVPAIFVRLAGCNILCNSESWVCDTIDVWKKGKATSFEDVFSLTEINYLKNGAHLVFTGGEPLLHQDKIVKFVQWLYNNHNIKPIIEVETNGTILPIKELLLIVNYWNCSPKLSNSGEPYKRRVNPLAIIELNKQSNIIFKFVIEKEEDLFGIVDDYHDYLSMRNVCLMPAGDSQEKLEKTRKVVAELCIQQGLRYSERLHIVIWNQKTGV